MKALGSINARLLLEVPGGAKPIFLGDVAIPLKASRKSSPDQDGEFATYEISCSVAHVRQVVQEVFKQSGGDGE